MTPIDWTDERIRLMKNLYPISTNAELAALIGVSIRTLINKVQQMGLSKTMSPERLIKAKIIVDNFNNCSYSELATLSGMNRSSVVRIAAKLGLRKNKETNFLIRSRIRREMIEHDRRRIRIGLSPLTKLVVRD